MPETLNIYDALENNFLSPYRLFDKKSITSSTNFILWFVLRRCRRTKLIKLATPGNKTSAGFFNTTNYCCFRHNKVEDLRCYRWEGDGLHFSWMMKSIFKSKLTVRFNKWIFRRQSNEKPNSITYLPGVHTRLYFFLLGTVRRKNFTMRYVKTKTVKQKGEQR